MDSSGSGFEDRTETIRVIRELRAIQRLNSILETNARCFPVPLYEERGACKNEQDGVGRTRDAPSEVRRRVSDASNVAKKDCA